MAKSKLFFTLIMTIVMMAISPQKMWAGNVEMYASYLKSAMSDINTANASGFTVTFTTNTTNLTEVTSLNSDGTVKLYTDGNGNYTVAPVTAGDVVVCSNCQDMFRNRTNLKSVDLRGLNTSSNTTITSMFDGCTGLESVDLSNFDTSSLTAMSYTFENCSSLTTLDLSSFNTSKVQYMNGLFQGCSNLTTIYASENFVTTNSSSSDGLFIYCTKLRGGNCTEYNSSYTGVTYARIDTDDTPGYFTAPGAQPCSGKDKETFTSDQNGTALTTSTDGNKVNIAPKTTIWYSFTPETSGTYRFHSVGSGDLELNSIELDNQNLTLNGENDDPYAANTSDFNITADLTVGNTYMVYIMNFADEKAKDYLVYVEFVSGSEQPEEDPAQKFVDFKINFTKSWASASTITEGTTYYVTATDADGIPTYSAEQPADGKYLFTFKAKYHGNAYGTCPSPVFTVPVDGPVKVYYGTNDYGGDITVKNSNGETVLTGNSKGAKFSENPANVMSMTYAKDKDVLTFTGGGYVPYFAVEAVDIQSATLTYKDQNGNELGTADTFEGAAVGDIPESITSQVSVPEGEKLRGWYYSNGKKVKADDAINGNTTITALVTPIETVTVGSVQEYTLTSDTFYPEDHETISTSGGYYHDSSHGWAFGNGESVSVQVAGNAQVVLSLCVYSKDNTIVVTDAAGNTIETIASGKVATDGTNYTVNYKGEATTLTITYTQGESYLHKIVVTNVQEIMEKDKETGYFMVPAGNAESLVLAINSAKAGDKIFLPNGTYDLGEKVLTTISTDNLSIIGESMEGTIIKNAPDKSVEGISTTATLLNTSTGLYMQDLTIQNALDYYNAGTDARAVCLQDKGTKTICKNVRMLSYQDTYYSNKQGAVKYFEDGEIHGTVDFICGDGSVYFKNVGLICEQRTTSGGGSDAITASNAADTDKGYVLDGCTIKYAKDITGTLPVVSLGRAWNNAPQCVYLNTIVDDSNGRVNFQYFPFIVRWTLTSMNKDVFPKLFGEYNTVNTGGDRVISGSNKLTFTDLGGFTDGTDGMETILTAEQAATYTIDYVLGDWATTAQADATQVTKMPSSTDGHLYLVPGDGTTASYITTKCPESGKVRIANDRGGFGPEIKLGSESEVQNTPVINYCGYATFSAAFDWKVATEGVKAYKASVDETTITLTELEGYIPAGAGVLLSGDVENVLIDAKSESDTQADMEGNELKATTNADGTLAAMPTDKVIFALGAEDKFQEYIGTAFIHNRAYLEFDSNPLPSDAKAITIVFADGDATGIHQIENGSLRMDSSRKLIENGRIVIVKNGKKFTAAGQLLK